MAESDTILQLGIEAAREGNRDEARSLFSLLTRQEPDNLQAWLWLAGVAETPDERRAALERVIAIDPGNEMASKGLTAMGVTPAGAQSVPVAPVLPTTPDFDDEFESTPAAPAIYTNLSDEERYAAELDNAFDDYDAVEKVGGSVRNTPTSYGDDETVAAVGAGSARDRIASRRNARARQLIDEDDDEAPPRRNGFSPLALALGGIILLGLLGLILWNVFSPRGDDGGVAGSATATALASGGAGAGTAGTATPDGGGVGVVPTTDAPVEILPYPAPGDATPAPAETPAVQPPVGGDQPDPVTANPAQVAVGTPIEANGFTFTFPSATFAASLGGTIGSQVAQNGRFVVVLVALSNATGTEQVVPANLFVLKDAQGRVFTTNSAASEAYVIPGVNADLSLEDPLPANSLAYNTALVFDVAPDSTGLVLFSRFKQDQGFLVLP